MSHALVVDLAKRILAAQKDVSYCYREVRASNSVMDRLELALAHAYLGGLCEAMALAASGASVQLKGGAQRNMDELRAQVLKLNKTGGE